MVLQRTGKDTRRIASTAKLYSMPVSQGAVLAAEAVSAFGEASIVIKVKCNDVTRFATRRNQRKRGQGNP